MLESNNNPYKILITRDAYGQFWRYPNISSYMGADITDIRADKY